MHSSDCLMHAHLVRIQGMEKDAHVLRPVEHCPAGHIRKSRAGEVCTPTPHIAWQLHKASL